MNFFRLLSANASRILADLMTPPIGFQPDQARFYVLGQIIFPIGFLAHAGFMVLFWYLDQTVLAAFNVLSLALFSFGMWQHNKGEMQWNLYLVGLFEVPVHAALATAFLGISAGYWLHVFIIISFLALVPFYSRTTRIVLGFVYALIASAIVIYGLYNEPINPVSKEFYILFMASNIVVLAALLLGMIASYDVAVARAEDALQIEFSRAEALLLNVLPTEIAARLKAQEEPLADAHENVSVLFADLAGFTDLSRNMSADELVNLLNDLFSRFDKLAMECGAEKIKTIGDAYMVATGLSGSVADHAEEIADLALGMQRAFGEFRRDNKVDLKLRIGVHSGTVVAGVIGKQKFSYDLWGDTVNVASRMESEGIADQIQISAETWKMLSDRYRTSPRGEIQIKGHRPRTTYLLEGHA
jgi:class 3 adenylate cyclase